MKKEIPLLFGSLKDKALFDPEHVVNYFRKEMNYISKSDLVIFSFNKRFNENLVKQVKVKKFFDVNHQEVCCFNYAGKKVGSIFSRAGSSMAGIALEECLVLGIKNFIFTGSAGGLSTKLSAGDFVIPDKAIRDEGTSYHYAKPTKYAFPDKQLTQKLINATKKLGVCPFVGTTWTTDALYRETLRKIKKYFKEGVLTVEMESSALFAVAKYRQVKIAGVYYVSDLLHGKEWQPHFKSKKAVSAENKLVDICLKFIEEL